MIKSLYIQNLALIKEANINFSKGLNIISGETGAGKSMLIQSLKILMGTRLVNDLVRHNTETLTVKGEFFISNNKINENIQLLGIKINENNILSIKRVHKKGSKSQCYINNKQVTLITLKKIGEYLIDLYTQHENQTLSSANKQLLLIDNFCGNSLNENKKTLAENIKHYKNIETSLNAINSLKEDNKNTEEAISLLEHEKNEIEEADLQNIDEEKLFTKYQQLINCEKILKSIQEVLTYLNGITREDISIVDRLYKSTSILNDIYKIDKSIFPLLENIEDISILANELYLDIKSYAQNIEYNETESLEIQKKLNLVYNLKRKYGETIDDINKYYNDIILKLDYLIESKDKIRKLEQEKLAVVKNILEICNVISKTRKNSAEELEKKLEEALTHLGMKNSEFKIKLSKKKSYGINGYDKVDFYMSTNIGEPLKPISKIASGGEMSRIMVAIKSILAPLDDICTFIFDEIDTGVSGVTAQKVGEKLALISKEKQVICITHLPQIAVKGENHFLIEKTSDNINTQTNIIKLDESQIIEEIARLIGGEVITSSTITTAKELREANIKSS